MKFPLVDVPDWPQLLFFDSWEADRLVRVLYYSLLVLVWFLCVVFTVWATVNYFLSGLVVAGLLSVGAIFTVILCVRVVLEGCLSLFVIRDAVSRVEDYRGEDFSEEGGEDEEGELVESSESENDASSASRA